MRQQGVSVGQMGVGMNRDRGHLELGTHCPLVERFDVL